MDNMPLMWNHLIAGQHVLKRPAKVLLRPLVVKYLLCNWALMGLVYSAKFRVSLHLTNEFQFEIEFLKIAPLLR